MFYPAQLLRLLVPCVLLGLDALGELLGRMRLLVALLQLNDLLTAQLRLQHLLLRLALLRPQPLDPVAHQLDVLLHLPPRQLRVEHRVDAAPPRREGRLPSSSIVRHAGLNDDGAVTQPTATCWFAITLER